MPEIRFVANRTAECFFSDAQIVAEFPVSENHVFEIAANGQRLILRITPKTHRSRVDIDAEIAILLALVEKGFSASQPLAFPGGEFIFETELGWATVFEFAPGQNVQAFGPAWNEELFRDWGEVIGLLHRCAGDLPEASARFAWNEDPNVVRIPESISGEPVAVRTHERLFPSLSIIPPGELILVHGDFGLANFHRDSHGRITVFDFDDCCRFTPSYDVAVALWPLRGKPAEERAQYLEWMLEGYGRQTLAPDMQMIQTMFEWRNLFMFAYWRRKWGDIHDEQQTAWMDRMRIELDSPTQWN